MLCCAVVVLCIHTLGRRPFRRGLRKLILVGCATHEGGFGDDGLEYFAIACERRSPPPPAVGASEGKRVESPSQSTQQQQQQKQGSSSPPPPSVDRVSPLTDDDPPPAAPAAALAALTDGARDSALPASLDAGASKRKSSRRRKPQPPLSRIKTQTNHSRQTNSQALQSPPGVGKDSTSSGSGGGNRDGPAGKFSVVVPDPEKIYMGGTLLELDVGGSDRITDKVLVVAPLTS